MSPCIRIAALLGAALLAASPTAKAASSCYDSSYYPSVFRIEQAGAGIRAQLGRPPFSSDGLPVQSSPVLVHETGKAWTRAKDFDCPYFPCRPRDQGCEEEIPSIPLSREDALRLRSATRGSDSIEQDVSACVRDGERVYFGIGFYGGEGVSGVGGIGRYDRASGELEIRRPDLLRDSSVNQLVKVDDTLFIGTTARRECTGTPPPTHGLLRYDWNARALEPVWGACGLVVHDFHRTGNSLWVATDLGLSRLDTESKFLVGWENFVPDLASKELMRRVHCEDLYKELLGRLAGREADWNRASAYQDLFTALARLRRDFLARYVWERSRGRSALPGSRSRNPSID